MKKFKKIKQFRDAVKTLRYRRQYVGNDDEGNPIYDENRALGTATFNGTTKLHGTNAGIHVVVDNDEITITPQSRTQTQSGAGGHFGFVEWVRRNEDRLKELVKEIQDTDLVGNDFTIFGEWAGRGIQKGVACSELDKFFYFFDVWDVKYEEYVDYDFVEETKPLQDIRFFNAYDTDLFPRFEVTVDLADPIPAEEEINKLTLEVEKECPVSKVIARLDGLKDNPNRSSVGEGIVWIQVTTRASEEPLTFKTKGDKHAGKGSGMKATLDPIMAKAVNEFVERVVTEARCDSVYAKVEDEKGAPLEMKDLGKLMPALFEDIMDEEKDALINGQPIEKKMVGPAISNAGRKLFMNRINAL